MHYRYGYRLWLDEKTAMPLRSEVVNGAGEAVEAIHFTRLEVRDRIDRANSSPPWTRRDSSGCAPGGPDRRWRPPATGGRARCRRDFGWSPTRVQPMPGRADADDST